MGTTLFESICRLVTARPRDMHKTACSGGDACSCHTALSILFLFGGRGWEMTIETFLTWEVWKTTAFAPDTQNVDKLMTLPKQRDDAVVISW